MTKDQYMLFMCINQQITIKVMKTNKLDSSAHFSKALIALCKTDKG